jgi:hypothetical protein
VLKDETDETYLKGLAGETVSSNICKINISILLTE